MNDITLKIELLSSFLSVMIILIIFFKIFQYKQKLDVLKEFDRLKDMNTLTAKDKEVIKQNKKEYQEKLIKAENLLKFAYPIFITLVAIFILLFSMQKALIYLNVIIVAYIYLHINRLHLRNFTKFLEELDS